MYLLFNIGGISFAMLIHQRFYSFLVKDYFLTHRKSLLVAVSAYQPSLYLMCVCVSVCVCVSDWLWNIYCHSKVLTLKPCQVYNFIEFVLFLGQYKEVHLKNRHIEATVTWISVKSFVNTIQVHIVFCKQQFYAHTYITHTHTHTDPQVYLLLMDYTIQGIVFLSCMYTHCHFIINTTWLDTLLGIFELFKTHNDMIYVALLDMVRILQYI